MKYILFVCTGNTCRSPMAEAIFQSMIKARAEGSSIRTATGLFSIAQLVENETGVASAASEEELPTAISAGLYAHEGDPATREARQVIAAYYQGNLLHHRAQVLHHEQLEASSLILTMTAHQRDSLLDIWPDVADKVFTLSEYAVGIDADVEDPYGLDEEAYIATAAQISDLIVKLIDKLFDKDGQFG